MDQNEIQRTFEALTDLYAKLDTRLMALQIMVERTSCLGGEQLEAFRADLNKFEGICYRLKMERAEDISPEIAAKLFDDEYRKPKTEEGE